MEEDVRLLVSDPVVSKGVVLRMARRKGVVSAMRFNQLPRLIGKIDVDESDSVKLLPQFYRADIDLAWRLGGEQIRAILSRVGMSRSWRHISIDSRASMLMAGMYPCIPGWHCDDFYRPNGQPDLENVMRKAPSEHIFMLIGSCSKTVFLVEPWSWRPSYQPYMDDSLYSAAHKALQESIESGKGPGFSEIEPGELWNFSPISWHRGAPAKVNGWRYFIRITGSNHWEPKNEIRTQTQVYLTSPFAGW